MRLDVSLEEPPADIVVQAEALRGELDGARAELASTQERLRASEEKRQEVEKEQEDLLVLLDELNGKRRRDKQLMRTAGLEVSEDEEEDDEDDEDEE